MLVNVPHRVVCALTASTVSTNVAVVFGAKPRASASASVSIQASISLDCVGNGLIAHRRRRTKPPKSPASVSRVRPTRSVRRAYGAWGVVGAILTKIR